MPDSQDQSYCRIPTEGNSAALLPVCQKQAPSNIGLIGGHGLCPVAGSRPVQGQASDQLLLMWALHRSQQAYGSAMRDGWGLLALQTCCCAS